MELDRISSYKIRVSLSEEELLRYELKIDDSTDRDRVRESVSELLFDLGEPMRNAECERLLLAIHELDGGGQSSLLPGSRYRMTVS